MYFRSPNYVFRSGRFKIMQFIKTLVIKTNLRRYNSVITCNMSLNFWSKEINEYFLLWYFRCRETKQNYRKHIRGVHSENIWTKWKKYIHTVYKRMSLKVVKVFKSFLPHFLFAQLSKIKYIFFSYLHTSCEKRKIIWITKFT